MRNKAHIERIESYLEVASQLEGSDSSVIQTAALLNDGDAEIEVIEGTTNPAERLSLTRAFCPPYLCSR